MSIGNKLVWIENSLTGELIPVEQEKVGRLGKQLNSVQSNRTADPGEDDLENGQSESNDRHKGKYPIVLDYPPSLQAVEDTKSHGNASVVYKRKENTTKNSDLSPNSVEDYHTSAKLAYQNGLMLQRALFLVFQVNILRLIQPDVD